MVKKKEKIIDPLKDRKSKRTEHYNAVLIEHLDSKFDLVLEHSKETREVLIKKIDEKFTEQDQKISDIQLAIKQHGEKLSRMEIKLDKVIEKVEEHDQKIQEIKTTFVAH